MSIFPSPLRSLPRVTGALFTLTLAACGSNSRDAFVTPGGGMGPALVSGAGTSATGGNVSTSAAGNTASNGGSGNPGNGGGGNQTPGGGMGPGPVAGGGSGNQAGASSGGGGMPNVEPVNTGGVPEPQIECQGSFEAAALDGAAHSVSVDNAMTWGALPHFWNTYGTGHLGLFLEEHEQEPGWAATLKRHVVDGVANLDLTSVRQHGLLHDDVAIYSEPGGTPTYDFTRSDEIFDFLVENGVKPIVEFGNMPAALASDPNATVFHYESGISYPKDYSLWQEMIYQFVQHSVDRYGAEEAQSWYYEVWNEPECCSGKFWTGSLEQYFELYDHTFAGVRRALPNGRVGGPVASQPRELTQNSMLGTLFLDHVTTDSYVTPGTPSDLDFFAYHSWSFIDGAVNGYFGALDLLDSYGMNSTQIAVTEFGPTYEFNLYDEPQETRQGAAFVAQTYTDISRRCGQDGKRFPITFSWWVLSDVFREELYREDEPFIGCMGLTSREDIHKPAYNAFKFLAQMGNEQIPFSLTSSGGVGGMASKSADGGVQILLYNAQNPGMGPTNDTYYEVTAAHEIALTVSGLDASFPYDVTAYRVDDVKGNAYAAWEGMGRPTKTNMTEADWQTLRDTMDSPAEPLARALCGTSFTQRLSLPSPGVLLVKLTPAAP